jgi:hypothetical protein
MIAYSVFQDWGNDPVAYRTGPKAQLLSLIQKLFPATIAKGPDQPTFQQIASLLGHDEPLVQTADSKFASANPPLKWHFMVDGPKHPNAIAFDNRTRRSYVTCRPVRRGTCRSTRWWIRSHCLRFRQIGKS